jgi:excisionase family DNA binding protein
MNNLQAFPEVLTPKEAAALLRCGVGTIYADCRRKRLPFFRVGRCLRFRRAELLALKGGR